MISRECPKCGHGNASVKYDDVLWALRMNCVLCGYRWQVKPLDVVRADFERQAAQSAALKGEKP